MARGHRRPRCGDRTQQAASQEVFNLHGGKQGENQNKVCSAVFPASVSVEIGWRTSACVAECRLQTQRFMMVFVVLMWNTLSRAATEINDQRVVLLLRTGRLVQRH